MPPEEPATVSVPVLRNSSTGGTQHALASTVAPVLMVNAPEELMSAAKASTGPAPSTVVGPWKASREWVLPGDISCFLVVPLTVVWMLLPTSRLPSMVPPVQENLPLPTKVPGPKNSAFPVSVMVVLVLMNTPVASVIDAPISNWSVPPPLRLAPGPNAPGPPVTSSRLPGTTWTEPLSLNAMSSMLPVPAAPMITVPVLRNASGFTQHTEPRTTAPGATVSRPLLVIAGPASSIDSRPGPLNSAVPSKVIGVWTSASPAPLKDASPSTVSGEPRTSKPWLTLHEKLPATVTSPLDSDASVIVRSCNWVPPGTPVTTVRAGNLTAGMVTLSPFCGTELLAQFIASDQLVPSPPPVHVWLDDALAATGASKAAVRTPVPAARVPAAAIRASLRHVAEPSRFVRGCCLPRAARADGVMVTSHHRSALPWCAKRYPFAFIRGKDYPGITSCPWLAGAATRSAK